MRIKNINDTVFFGLSLLLGSFVMEILYFIVTKTFGPGPILIFLIPFLLGLCINNIKNKDYSFGIRLIYGIIFFSIMIALAIMTLSSIFTEYTTSPEYVEDFNRYYYSSTWFTNNLYGKHIFSDANTMGYMAIWCAKSNQYNSHPIYFHNIGLSRYNDLYKGTYFKKDIIAYNYNIYKKNLVMVSLESWNRFKALPPDIINRNSLNLLYNDDCIWVLSK